MAEQPGEKRVTWAELFFDLVFVFAITQVSGLLHDHHDWLGLARALVVFVPVYWAWVGTSIHANTHDVDTAHDRIGVFAVGVCSLFTALAVPEAYGDRGLLFGASYLAARIVLLILVYPSFRSVPVNSFSVAVCVTGPLLVAGGLVHGPARLVLWAMAGAADLLTLYLLRNRLTVITIEPAHLPERFGLFLIIALGESVVAIGVAASPDPTTPARLTAVAAAYVIAVALWWVYFAFAASAMRFAIESATVRTGVIRSVLSYGHLLFIASIISIAVGLGEAVRHPTGHLRGDVAALLLGGTALYLATFGYTRWRMFRKVSWTRLAAAAVCLALLPVAAWAPVTVTLGALAAVLVALNTLEAQVVRKTARPESPTVDQVDLDDGVELAES